MMNKYNILSDRTSKRYRIYSHLPRSDTKYPITLEIFPTNRCNTYCSFCAYSDLRNNEEIPLDIFDKLIEDILKLKIKSIIFAGGGEPLIYKNIHKYISKLANNNIDIGIITNGLHLNQELIEAIRKCSWIRFSLLSSNPKDFNHITGTHENNHYIICNNIKKLTSVSTNNLYVSALYMSNVYGDNLNKVKDFINLAWNLKVDQIFFKNLLKNFVETKQEQIDFYNDNENEIEEVAKKYQIVTNIKKFNSKEESPFKKKDKNEPCDIIRLNLIGLINANGDYFPCLYQYTFNGIKYGNIKEENLESILNRKEEYSKQIELKSCEFCRHWALRAELARYKKYNNILKCKDPHKNFI